MRPRIDIRRLGRWIRLTLLDPWQLVGSTLLIVAVFGFTIMVGLARRALPPTGGPAQAVTVAAPASSPSSRAPSPASSPAPQPSLQVQPVTAPTAPAQSASPTAKPQASVSPPARPTPTPAPSAAAVDYPPTVVLSVSLYGPVPLRVIADATGSTDPDATGIARFVFDFGDGFTVQAGGTAVHTYSTAGTFTVRVTATDTAGFSATTTREITVP